MLTCLRTLKGTKTPGDNRLLAKKGRPGLMTGKKIDRIFFYQNETASRQGIYSVVGGNRKAGEELLYNYGGEIFKKEKTNKLQGNTLE